jgi:hypothetical protein
MSKAGLDMCSPSYEAAIRNHMRVSRLYEPNHCGDLSSRGVRVNVPWGDRQGYALKHNATASVGARPAERLLWEGGRRNLRSTL